MIFFNLLKKQKIYFCIMLVIESIRKNVRRELYLILCMVSVCIFSLPSQAEISKSIQDVVNPYGYVSARISPDTKRVALIEYNGYEHSLILFDIESKKSRVIKTSKQVTEGFWVISKQPRNIIWINNSVIAVDYGVQVESIDLEGKTIAFLGESERGFTIIGKITPDQGDSTELLLKFDGDDVLIKSVNALTGKATPINLPIDGKLIDWALDRHGELRVATYLNAKSKWDTNTISHWYKSPETDSWERLEVFKSTEEFWEPMYVPNEKDVIVVSSRNGRNTRAVFKYDVRQRKITDLMAGHPTQDIFKVIGLDKEHFDSVATNGLVPQQVWFDPAWQALQASVDQALPSTTNSLFGDPQKNVLVFSTSDTDPGTWSTLEVSQRMLTEIGKYKVAVNRDKMHKMFAFEYSSTDGISIPAYITHPDNLDLDNLKHMKNVAPKPMIVLIHGGPITRNHWEWDQEVQLLASEGYIVFQPQFRGSTGFGKQFETAGYRQWGLMMQDDITAGVEYLIANGVADRNKICIYGASFGGYAAMWGLVKTPNLYKCGVSFAGVVDINFMLDDQSDSNSNPYARDFLRLTVGDQQQDKVKFDAVSPLKHSDKIIAPLLLIHGEEDKRVPISHSKKMMKALDKNGKSYEWLALQDEGHGVHLIHNQIGYFTKLITFLRKHLQPAKINEAVN